MIKRPLDVMFPSTSPSISSSLPNVTFPLMETPLDTLFGAEPKADGVVPVATGVPELGFGLDPNIYIECGAVTLIAPKPALSAGVLVRKANRVPKPAGQGVGTCGAWRNKAQEEGGKGENNPKDRGKVHDYKHLKVCWRHYAISA
jgi:hypothetical protein